MTATSNTIQLQKLVLKYNLVVETGFYWWQNMFTEETKLHTIQRMQNSQLEKENYSPVINYFIFSNIPPSFEDQPDLGHHLHCPLVFLHQNYHSDQDELQFVTPSLYYSFNCLLVSNCSNIFCSRLFSRFSLIDNNPSNPCFRIFTPRIETI